MNNQQTMIMLINNHSVEMDAKYKISQDNHILLSVFTTLCQTRYDSCYLMSAIISFIIFNDKHFRKFFLGENGCLMAATRDSWLASLKDQTSEMKWLTWNSFSNSSTHEKWMLKTIGIGYFEIDFA